MGEPATASPSGEGLAYDVAIIGAGLSGLAAGIRLAHFGRRVVLLERHSAVGGLNSFYSQGGRRYDVGLHAVTNYLAPGAKGTPLARILRQLRIEREQLDPCPQVGSRIAFGPSGGLNLRFTNDPALLESEVASAFPAQADGYRRMAAVLHGTSMAPETLTGWARPFIRTFIDDPVLEDMLLCPVLYYGSAREHDVELGQFAILFRALYLEGFWRPFGGIRILLRLLTEKFREAGGVRRMNCGVAAVISRGGRAVGLRLDSGEEIAAGAVLSCAGAEETDALIGAAPAPAPGEPDPAGLRRLAFVETMAVFDRPSASLGWGSDTIVFFNDSGRFHWERPDEAVDLRSGVACFPGNFRFGDGRTMPEGVLRCTCLASHAAWAGLGPEAYAAAKAAWFGRIQASARRFLPAPSPAPEAATVATDMFTPTTIVRYTGHREGAIYGAPVKRPDGRTALPNVHLCGTDQGMLGITGSMMSGIAMANSRILAAKTS